MEKNKFIYIIVAFIIIATEYISAQNSSITGKVYDSQSSTPLSGAIVTIVKQELSTSTNLLGEYIFSNLPQGSYKIKIEYIGYKTNTIEVSVLSDQTANPTTYLSDNILTISEIKVTATTNYGNISISPIDMKLRPINTAQDLLRLVPGLFIAQHAGGGKAEQLFLRGFDIDHGTDINISVDDIPVNMTSHAHGQGYADLHFVIPETIEGFDLYKGPYYSKFGDLGTSGSVAFNTKNSIEKSLAKLEFGRFNSYRGLLMFSILGKKGLLKTKKQQNFYIASEYSYTDGYTEEKQKFNRLNVFGKYFAMLSKNTILSLTGSTFNSHWNASGQVPVRAIENNYITRFGSIDATEGGNTNRTNINLTISNSLSNNSSLSNQLYYVRYGFNLYSNFTFFLKDSLNGDQIQQYENRNIFGFKSAFSFLTKAGKSTFSTELAIGARIDDIDSIFLASTFKRDFLNFKAAGKILQKDFFAYLDEKIEISKIVINPGVRVDYFDYDLTDDLDNLNSGKQTAIRIGPKLSLYYNVDPKTQIYVKGGIGFHSNDARVVVIEETGNTLPAAKGYEVGTSFTLGNAFINMSLWGLDLESELVYVGDEAVVEPSGRTRRLGIDLSGRYQFNSWIWLDLDINYAKGKFLDEPEDSNRIPLAPVITSVGGISFKLQNGLSGRLGYRFLDDRPANEVNTVTAKGYFIADGVLNFTTRIYEIGISVENLFNNKNFNEAQFDTESRLPFEQNPVSELHFTPGSPFSLKGNFTLFF